ncbi:MAG: hypothetical protein K8R21_16490 [Leptospira sp.]|nr:hypothetical protein [Leptospira sp.]
MQSFRVLFLVLVTSLLFLACTQKKENKVDLSVYPFLDPGIKTLFLTNGIDSDLTPNCGTGTPATASTTGTTGTSTGATSSGSKTANTRFTILSQLVMKVTHETLNMKFIYDTTQTQGSIDQQQGFTFTGGVFADTIAGKQGTVKWLNSGVNIDDTNTGTQIIQFLKVELNLSGTYTPGSGTTTTPTQCYTVDNINCTSATATTQCFTTDNAKCISSATGEGATPIIIRGTINCNAKNVPVQ